MGQMATFTPGIKFARKIPRLTIKNNEVKLIPQTNPKTIHGKVIYTRLGEFIRDTINPGLDILWRMSLSFAKPMPVWSKWMQMIPSEIPQLGYISIDMTPSDPTCVRSTLEYLSDHARSHRVTPIITFDQLLWWIWYMIIYHNQLKVYCIRSS